MTMDIASETAPAKVNLALHVTGQRSNGYHDLESLVVFAELGDELTAQRAPADRLSLSGPFAASLSSGQSNLVIKAVNAFRARWPEAVPFGVHISLAKNLPVAAGIGGGSADAAAALRLMRRLSAQPIAPEALAEIANSLGADVPVCLLSLPCLARGTGDIAEPLPQFPHTHILLVNPLVPLATADVFRALKRRDNPGLPDLPQPLIHPAMLGIWLEETRNDLEAPAFEIVPAIANLVASVRQTNGCVAARMSGSGATVYGLYGSSALAHQAAHDVRAQFPDYWVAAAPIGTP